MNRITFTTPKGEGFIAEFDREICASMEERNLTPEQVAAKPAAKMLTFFYWAFKKNHPKVNKDITDEVWKGLPSDGKKQVFETLARFWEEARDTLMDEPEDDSKKVKWEIG